MKIYFEVRQASIILNMLMLFNKLKFVKQ